VKIGRHKSHSVRILFVDINMVINQKDSWSQLRAVFGEWQSIISFLWMYN